MKPKKLLSFILATVMAISLLPTFTITASAATTTTEKNITLGTSALSGYDSTNGYDYIYYGTYDSNPIKWRILSMNGNDGTYKDSKDETVASTNAMFLLSEYALKQMAYESAQNTDDDDGQTKPSDWRYSDAWYWCNDTTDSTSFISSSFTVSEKAYLLKTSKDNTRSPYTDELKGDTFFFLSYAEASQLNDRVAKMMSNPSGKAAGWWLRSPDSDFDVNFVDKRGSISYDIVGIVGQAARPAFNLNLSSVLFTSAAKDGKKTDNIGTLSANTENKTGEYKLTLLDKSRNFKVDEISKNPTVTKGGTFEFGFSKAKTEENEYISVMLVKDDAVAYYGHANVSQSGEFASFTVPEDIAAGTYELRIFNEQINGDYKTDYSSAFHKFTLKVVKSTPSASDFAFAPTNNNLTYDGNTKTATVVSKTNISGMGNVTVKYYDKIGTKLEDAPKNAGTYTVKIDVAEGSDYTAATDLTAVDWKFTISQAAPTENPDNKTTARVKRGRTLAEATFTNGEMLAVDGSALSGTFTWVDDTAEAINADCTKQMTFTPTDANYAPITVDVAVSTYSSGGSNVTPVYTVSFDTDGGADIKAQIVSKNGKASKPTAPAKDGYTFNGWYTDSEFTAEYDFDTKVTKNITLYAKWVENEVQEPSDDKNDDNKDDEQKPTTDEWKNPFTDITSADWFFDNVRYANENGLMSGVTNTEFAPSLPLTRGMLATILYRLAGEPAVNKSIPFADVTADSYYSNAVIWAEQNGIVSGISETEFAPDESITREQIATIIYRYAKYTGIAPTGAWAIRLNYADVADISDYAVEGVMYCTMKNIMQGKDNNMFAPKDNATRAEIAAILNRFIESNK